VGSGEEALTALAEGGFQLVLMDVQMPGTDGLQATARQRERERATGARVPIVAMTAHAMASDRERCLSSGMDAYVSKPLDPQVLFDTIEQLVPPSAFDLPALRESVGGNEALAQRIAALFVEQCPRLMAAVRDAVDRGDAAALFDGAHTLKGAVANFPAPAAFEAAERLETIGRGGDLMAARDAYTALEQAIDRLQTELARLSEPVRSR
jgi:two-component system sensor histidine kinase/response regulator